MSKYTVTIRNNEKEEEKSFSGDMFLIGIGNIDDKGIIRGNHMVEGNYFMLSRLYVGQGANLQHLFSEIVKEEK